MNKFEKVAMAIVGLELAGCAVLSVFGFGKAMYHKGRLDMSEELKEKMTEIAKEFQENYSTQSES